MISYDKKDDEIFLHQKKKENSKYNNDMIKKNYESLKKKVSIEKFINPFIIAVDKVYLIFRNPISPYITEKVKKNVDLLKYCEILE